MIRPFVLLATAALALAACTRLSGSPETSGYFPSYELGIDQDISASHNVGGPQGSGVPEGAPWKDSIVH